MTQLRIVIFLLVQWPFSSAVHGTGSGPSTANHAGSNAQRSVTRERPASNGETRKNFCTSKYSQRVHAQLVIPHHAPRIAYTLCQSPSAYARSFHSQFFA
jgi:hypothetical protein